MASKLSYVREALPRVQSAVESGGANAYLTKTTDPDEIYQAILTCMNDDFYFNDLVNKAVLSKLQTKRQVRQFYPSPIKFSDFTPRITGAPLLGEHNDDVLSKLGYNREQIAKMRSDKIV